MKITFLSTMLLAFLTLSFISCEKEPPVQSDTLTTRTDSMAVSANPPKSDVPQFSIKDEEFQPEVINKSNGYMGIHPGDKLDEINARYEKWLELIRLEKEGKSMRTKRLVSVNGSAPALLLPTFEQPDIIERIVITAPGPKTDEGIGVGDSWQQVRAAYPSIKLEKTEEGYAMAHVDNFYFLMDTVYKSSLPASQKVLSLSMTKE